MPYSGPQSWNKWLKGGTIRKAVADVEEPTIDLEKENRPEVPIEGGDEGEIGTIYSQSFEEEDGVIRLAPTIVDGKQLDPSDAYGISRRTGRHLGRYSSEPLATQAAQEMHLDEERRSKELKQAREKAKTASKKTDNRWSKP